MSASTFFSVRKGLALAAVVTLGSVLVQLNAVARLRAENQQLQAVALKRQKTVQAVGARGTEEAAEIARLRGANRDLLRLRNEVRQVREIPREMEKLRARLQQVRASRAAGKTTDSGIPPDYLVRDQLADAGAATPETTVQTYFWAGAIGNLERLSQIVGGQMARDLANVRKEEMEVSAKFKRSMDSFPGFRIAENQMVNADEVIVGIQTTENGVVMRMKLQKIGNEWKLTGLAE